jgi:FMN phosphatase YigB (HAD superfamily)
MLRAYDAVIFDLLRVMTAFEPEKFARQILDDPHQAIRVRRATLNTGTWLDLLRGRLTEAEAEARTIAANPYDAEDIRRFFHRYKEYLLPIPEGVSILGRVKKAGFRTYTLLNIGAEAWEGLRRRYDFFKLFDGVVTSSQEELVKPDPAFFERLIQRYSLEPGRCVFTDEAPMHVEMARYLGFDGIHFENHRQLTAALEARGILDSPEEMLPFSDV